MTVGWSVRVLAALGLPPPGGSAVVESMSATQQLLRLELEGARATLQETFARLRESQAELSRLRPPTDEPYERRSS